MSHCSTARRPLWMRVAHLGVVAVLLSAVGASSSHTHASGSFDATRACAVCHSGEQPVAVAVSTDAVETPGETFSDPVATPATRPAVVRVTSLRSRAPPVV